MNYWLLPEKKKNKVLWYGEFIYLIFFLFSVLWIKNYIALFFFIHILVLWELLLINRWNSDYLQWIRNHKILLYAVLVIFIYPNYWFSDDSIRHIYDAFYFLRKIDVYQIPPILLPRVPGMEWYPNHPQYASIYFPFTQYIAIFSSLMTRYVFIPIPYISIYEFWFRLFFISITIILMELILKYSRKTIYLIFFSSPIFLIETLSLHTDIHGILILILTIHIPNSFLKGFLMGNLIFIKPEGGIIASGLACFYIIKFYYHSIKKLLNFIIGLIFILILYIISILFLYKLNYIDINTLDGFLNQAKIYNENFLSYQPFIIGIQNSYVVDSYHAILLYRKNIYPLLVILVVSGYIYFLFLSLKKSHSFSYIFFHIINLLLLIYFLYKASWQPWYFLWFIPIWIQLKWYPLTHYGLTLLLLWYIPVISLRLYHFYDYRFYFISLILWLIILIWCRKSKWTTRIQILPQEK